MEKELNFKNLSLNIERAVKRVKQDIRDDWFQDPFCYEDILTTQYIFEKLKKYEGTAHQYQPCKSIHIDIPKPGFTSRYSTETDIIDRVFLQAVVDIIAPHYDKLHSNRIYSHRLNFERSNEKYFFKYAIEEWRKFITDTSLELGDDNSVLLLTDLTNFYENIGITDLKDVLSLFKPKDGNEAIFTSCIDLIKSLLIKWCERNTERGIPQNRDTSSFLANCFLHPVDYKMQLEGFNYFRYMDDIRVVCKDKFEARRALKLLIQELRKKGLNVNSKKTQILNYNNVEEKVKIEASLSHNDKKIEQIDHLLKTRSARDVQIAVPMLRKKVFDLIENNNTDREFRYCINRLERIARNELLAEKIDFDSINKRILIELVDQPWSTDTFARYLGSVKLLSEDILVIRDLLLNSEKNVYEWQEFYLWQLLIRHKFSDGGLISAARRRVVERHNEATTAAACLFLGALGSVNDKVLVAENFRYFNDHLTQRFALLAVKDLNYNSIIKPHIQDYVIECYANSYKVLQQNYRDKFLHEIDSLKAEDIYADLPDDIS